MLDDTDPLPADGSKPFQAKLALADAVLLSNNSWGTGQLVYLHANPERETVRVGMPLKAWDEREDDGPPGTSGIGQCYCRGLNPFHSNSSAEAEFLPIPSMEDMMTAVWGAYEVDGSDFVIAFPCVFWVFQGTDLKKHCRRLSAVRGAYDTCMATNNHAAMAMTQFEKFCGLVGIQFSRFEYNNESEPPDIVITFYQAPERLQYL